MKPGILVREAVVVLAPDVRGQQVVQRGDLAPPRQVRGDLQPLGVLVEHRVDDVDERLVAVEEAVPAGEQVALEPALALVLAEHLHHAPVGARNSSFGTVAASHWRLVDLEDGLEAVGERLVGPKTRKLRCSSFSFVTSRRKRPSTRACRRCPARPAPGTSTGVVAEIRHPQVAQQHAAVGVRIRAHAPLALGRELGQFRLQAPCSSNSSSGR
jgi:hypothetical protein